MPHIFMTARCSSPALPAGTLRVVFSLLAALVFAQPIPAADSGPAASSGETSNNPASEPSGEKKSTQPGKAESREEKGPKRPFAPKELKLDGLLQTIRALPPERRQQLKENLQTWQNLSDTQKQQLRERHNFLAKKAAEELAACMPGTKLSPEEMEQLQKRYIEERRKIETKLRTEMESRRKAELEQLTEKFREELRQKNPSSEGN